MDLKNVSVVNYQIYKNGNSFVAIFSDYKLALRKMKSIADRGVYVELWACYSDGTSHLLKYAN